ncbi:MAG: hypothetical protein IKO16_06335 [Lachnospiraceae bacterium]|nr:hypothetical protein [Lachnospiraceae bacterium]
MAYELFEDAVEDVWLRLHAVSVCFTREDDFVMTISMDAPAEAISPAWKDKKLKASDCILYPFYGPGSGQGREQGGRRMTFTALVELQRGYLLSFATLVLILYIYCIIRMLDAGRKNLKFVCTCIIALAAFSLYQGMVMYQQEDLSSFDLPVSVLVVAFSAFLIFGAYMLYDIVVWQRTNISAMSVKEAFDRLPAGLAYYLPSGVPIMVNETMQQLSRCVISQPVTDANAFWDKITKFDGNAVIKDENNAIVNAGNKGIYNVRRSKVTVNGVEMYELTLPKGEDYVI